MFRFGSISNRYGAIFCIFLLLSGLACFFLAQRKFQIEHGKMEMSILNKINKITNVLSKLLYKTQSLASLIIQNNGEIINFEKTATAMVDDSVILNVLLAPAGIVQEVYPREGNEAVLGVEFFSEGAGNREAVHAQKTEQMVLDSPFPLVQGEEAQVRRLPIYLDDGKGGKRFWGLVSVTLKFPQALDGAELGPLIERGLAYEIWRINPGTGAMQIIASSPDYNEEASYLEKPLHILNSHWLFLIASINNADKNMYNDKQTHAKRFILSTR